MEVLFYIAIAVIYLIIQVRAAKKKQQEQQQTGAALPPAFPQQDAQSQQAVTLEEALREIRQSLGMETTPPQTPTTPPTRTAPSPREATPPSEFHAMSSTFADADFESKPTAFGTVPSIHQREKVPARREVPTRKQVPVPKMVPKSTLEKTTFSSTSQKVRATIKAPQVTTRSESTTPAADSDSLHNLLTNPKAARKAFILGEVLGPPRAYRPH